MAGALDADPHVEMDLAWRAGLAVVGGLARLSLDLRFHGVEHIPGTGGAILAANHVSALDAIVLALAAARRGRAVRYLAAEEALDMRLLGWAVRLSRPVQVRRGTADRTTLARAGRLLRAGALIGVFPEGTIAADLAPIRRGKAAARLALEAGTPVLPVGIAGTERRWPQPGLSFRGPLRPPVAVVIGPPLLAGTGGGAASTLRALSDRVIEGINERLRLAVRIAGPLRVSERPG